MTTNKPDFTALAIAISACAAISLFWAAILILVLFGSPHNVVASTAAAGTASTESSETSYIATFISFLLGGLASFLATLVAERLKRPKLVAEVLNHDVVYNPPRQARNARYLQVRVTNHELPWGLRWLGRNAAMFCSGKIDFRKESGEAVFGRSMPLRWSGTPEPIPMQIEIGGVTGRIVDHFRAHLEQRVDIPAGESRKFDVAAHFDGEAECYGWSNESYIPVVEWRNDRRRLIPGTYKVDATILHLGGRFLFSCRIVNQGNDPRIQTNA